MWRSFVSSSHQVCVRVDVSLLCCAHDRCGDPLCLVLHRVCVRVVVSLQYRALDRCGDPLCLVLIRCVLGLSSLYSIVPMTGVAIPCV